MILTTYNIILLLVPKIILMFSFGQGFITYHLLISAVASNRPTEALASVISLAFVVYST